MNSLAEYAGALTGFGYTNREAEFLYLVATHSGFFVQRQFAAYIGINGRGPVTDLIAKAQQKKHIREHPSGHGSRKLYHLFSRSVYAAIGKENSRNRRTGRYGLLEKPSIRILTLDFVLANPDYRYLEDDASKVAYFVDEEHIRMEDLPSKTFAGQNDSTIRRYFVERFPIFLSGSTPPAVNFTYIEDEIRSVQTFSSFLEKYRPLLKAGNGRFKLIFASDSTQSFPFAKRLFHQMFAPVDQQTDIQQLARFFRLRKLAEEKRFKELAHKDVVDWQRGLKRYSDPAYEMQYKIWRKTGSFPESIAEEVGQEISPRFETYLISPHWVREGSSAMVKAAPCDAPVGAPSTFRVMP